MKKLFGVAVIAVLMLFPFTFTACSLGGITEKTTIIYTDKLQPAINLSLRSSVLIQTNYGSGSGVIYEISGTSMYVITNWHVIAKDSNGANSNPDDDADPAGYYTVSPVSALEMDNSGNFVCNPAYRAETNIKSGTANDEDDVKLVGGSSYYDIAILRVSNTDLIDRFNLTAVTVFNGRLAYGDTAFAIGNSLGMGISVTEGVVSIPGEYTVDTDILPHDGEKVELLRRVIRITAAVQQGNSGGGLFNGAGELIGIVQSKPFYTGSVGRDEIIHSSNLPIDNIAYAVPTDVAVRIAYQMVSRDKAGEFTGVYNQDCLLIPYVGVTLGGTNRRADDSVTDTVYYIEDVFVSEITADCNINFEKNDIIRKVVCESKELSDITQIYQIREFLIECYSAKTITFFVERAGTAGLLELSGAFFDTGSDRP